MEREVDGHVLHCLRPEYTSPPFDRSLQRAALEDAPARIADSAGAVLVDDDGRQWFPACLLPEKLFSRFVAEPGLLLRLMDQRYQDFTAAADLIRSVHRRGDGSAPAPSDALRSLCRAYVLTLQYVPMANLLVDVGYERLLDLVLEVSPRHEANDYVLSLLRSPDAAAAAAAGFSEDVRGTKRISDVQSPPVMIFSEPVLGHAHVLDSDVALRHLRKGSYRSFASVRLVVPLIVQCAEEFRYIDYSTRTHLKALLAEHCSDIDPYARPYEEVIDWLGDREKTGRPQR